MPLPRLTKWFLRVGALLILASNAWTITSESNRLFAALVTAFGVLLVLVSFGFAFGQSITHRLHQVRRRQIVDTALAWATATVACGLAVTDPSMGRRSAWATIAIVALVLEALYRALANRQNH